jgi:hypothetical protein
MAEWVQSTDRIIFTGGSKVDGKKDPAPHYSPQILHGVEWSGLNRGLRGSSPTCLLNYSIEHSPSWEANLFSAIQENPRILCKLKFNHRIHKCQPPVPTWASSIQSVPPSHFLKIHLHIILPSVPESSNWTLSLRFPHQNPVHASPLPIHVTWPVHLILLDFIPRKYIW